MIKQYYHNLIIWHARLRPRYRRFFWIIVTTILILLFPQLLNLRRELTGDNNVDLRFVHPTTPIYLDHTFPLEVRLTSYAKSVNAVEFTLVFNPQVLEIVNMTTVQSFCSFYADNSFDNIKGEVNIACGTPNPGFTGDSVLTRITMRSKTVGNSEISLKKDVTRVLANDGKGTNLISTTPTISIPIKSSY